LGDLKTGRPERDWDSRRRVGVVDGNEHLGYSKERLREDQLEKSWSWRLEIHSDTRRRDSREDQLGKSCGWKYTWETRRRD